MYSKAGYNFCKDMVIVSQTRQTGKKGAGWGFRVHGNSTNTQL